MATYYEAWSRHSPVKGNPQGKLHAVQEGSRKTACGRTHAGIFSPKILFGAPVAGYAKHPDLCKDCERILGQRM